MPPFQNEMLPSGRFGGSFQFCHYFWTVHDRIPPTSPDQKNRLLNLEINRSMPTISIASRLSAFLLFLRVKIRRSEKDLQPVFLFGDAIFQSQLMWKQMVRILDMHQQLGDLDNVLRRSTGDKSHAQKEPNETKSISTYHSNVDQRSSPSKVRIEYLEAEVAKTKESERKMLESLVCQTKQLEQTKISLEEAKLEIISLKEIIKTLEGPHCQIGSVSERNHHSSFDMLRSKEEMQLLRDKLHLAVQAEEKSRVAMDALALALKEVSTECNQVKEKLSRTQSAIDTAKADAKCSKASLKDVEKKLQQVTEESRRLKYEAEESTATWVEKENGFINFMRMSEEEIASMKQENDRLIELLRGSREENSRLRDILKQAVSEATVVKEALEIARKENSHLKDTLTEKENALQSIKQEYDSLKVSEAAATHSVKQLQSLLSATSTMNTRKPASLPIAESVSELKPVVSEVKSNKTMAKFPSESWKRSNEHPIRRRYSIGESGRFEESVFDMAWSPQQQHQHQHQRKSRKSASFGNFTELRGPPSGSSASSYSGKTANSDEFSLADTARLDLLDPEEGSPFKLRKKRQLFRRFSDMLRRRSFHK